MLESERSTECELDKDNREVRIWKDGIAAIAEILYRAVGGLCTCTAERAKKLRSV